MKTKELLLSGISLAFVLLPYCKRDKALPTVLWMAPDTSTIPFTTEGMQIRLGRELIANTARYLGKYSNGMNCQNCHLAAGTVPWGNNFGAAYATYPKFRARSGTVESLEKKINDCLERSLNGAPIDSNSVEMRAMIAYMQWLGQGLPRDKAPPGSGIKTPPLLNTAANPKQGAILYQQYCVQCHGQDGAGQRLKNRAGYLYPPLWGNGSFNTGAGMYRITKIAGFIRWNMPFNNPVLSDQDAWNVAAFIVAQKRPEKKYPGDWPNIYTKPADDPFGPFADTFPMLQHKYGPFQPIQRAISKQSF